jgi:tetratricopeptide (TPR) repeat protein
VADDKLNPDPQSGEPAQAGGPPLDPAAGVSLYQEAEAVGGEINLEGLTQPQPESIAQPQPQLQAPRPDLAQDFPEEALGEAGAVKLPEIGAGKKGDNGRLTVVFVALQSFWGWLWAKLTAIPPLDDIFDNILTTFGLQRRPGSMLSRANSLARKGRLAEAVKWYRDYLALRPLAVAGYDGLGRIFFRMGLTEEANREFTIADSLERILNNRDDVEAAASLADAFLERKQARISVSLIEPVLIAHFYTPGNSVLLKSMVRVYTELRANKKAFQVCEAGLAQHPEDYEFHLMKGEAENRLGNTVEGERLLHWGRLMKKLKDKPQDAGAKMAMGEICLREQRMDEGLRLLREAAAILRQNTGVRWRLFNLYQKQGDYDSALKYLLEITALQPDNEDLQYRLADFYRKNKRREEAGAIYRTMIDRHPREPRPHILLGDLLTEMGSFEEAQQMKDLAQTLEAGLKTNPDHKDTVRFMKYLFSIGQNAEARQWLERGLAKWPYHGELVMTKVKMLYNEYNYKEAIALLKRIISVKSDVAEPHIWIAMCYQRLGDNMAALAESQLATRLAPKSYTSHKVLGDILKEQKKLSQANAAYEVAEMMRQGKK